MLRNAPQDEVLGRHKDGLLRRYAPRNDEMWFLGVAFSEPDARRRFRGALKAHFKMTQTSVEE